MCYFICGRLPLWAAPLAMGAMVISSIHFRRPRTSGPGCICVVRLERTARENALAGSAHLRPWHRHNHLRIPSPDQRHVRGEVSFVGRGPGEARSMAPAALAKNYAWIDRRGAGHRRPLEPSRQMALETFSAMLLRARAFEVYRLMDYARQHAAVSQRQAVLPTR